MLSGIFKGMPATGGLTRTRIVETSGAKTQMFSLVSSLFVLIVVLGLGFLFRDLPNVSLLLFSVVFFSILIHLFIFSKCCLAAIIFTALINNCFEIKKLYKLFNKSKTEAVITFLTKYFFLSRNK